MENSTNQGEIIDTTETYNLHILNTDKIENLEDCKKILKFLCEITIKPLPAGIEYNAFSDVKQYFD